MEIVANVIDGIKDTVFKGPDGSGILDLPVTRAEGADGKSVLISRWRPDEHERRLIAEGGDIFLWIYGGQHPPVFVSAEPPVVTKAPVEVIRVGLPTRKAAS